MGQPNATKTGLLQSSCFPPPGGGGGADTSQKGAKKLPSKRNRLTVWLVRFINFQASCTSVYTLRVQFSAKRRFCHDFRPGEVFKKQKLLHSDPHSPCFMRQMEIETLYCIQTFVFGVKGSFRLPPFKWCVVNRRYQNRKSWTIKEVLQSGDSYSYQIMR